MLKASYSRSPLKTEASPTNSPAKSSICKEQEKKERAIRESTVL